MFCSQCGIEVSSDSRFCYKCGNSLVIPPQEKKEIIPTIQKESFVEKPNVDCLSLVDCLSCNHIISKTALVCPACGDIRIKKKESPENKNKAKGWLGVAGATAAIVALGPAAILGAVASIASDLTDDGNKYLMKKAIDIAAIDCFQISNDCWTFVTQNNFHIPRLIKYEIIPWSTVKRSYLDPSNSRKERLVRSAKEVVVLERMSLKDAHQIVIEKHILTGYGNIKEKASIACAKFEEYASVQKIIKE